jgi:hypothetical protein
MLEEIAHRPLARSSYLIDGMNFTSFHRGLVVCVVSIACGCSSSGTDSSNGDAASDSHVLDVTPLDTPLSDANAPDHVKCGRTDVCDLSVSDCCARTGGGVCIPSGGDCDGFRITCDGPEDCGATQVCCVTAGPAPTNIACVAAEACVNETGVANRACHVDADCTGDARGPHCCFSGFGGVLVGTCEASTCP